jgi:hypothetical protein
MKDKEKNALPEHLLKRFDLENMFDRYLEIADVDKRVMIPYQLKQMKKAFYGGVGQLMLLITMELSGLPMEQVNQIYHYMLKQVNDYWAENLKVKGQN